MLGASLKGEFEDLLYSINRVAEGGKLGGLNNFCSLLSLFYFFFKLDLVQTFDLVFNNPNISSFYYIAIDFHFKNMPSPMEGGVQE